MAKSTDTLGVKGESEVAKWVFGSLLVLLAAGKFVQSSDGLAAGCAKRRQMRLQASWDPWARWR